MDLRDEMAKAALQGLIVSETALWAKGLAMRMPMSDDLAKRAYLFADAMLDARKNVPEK